MKKLDLDTYYTVMSTEGVDNFRQGFRCDGARPVRVYQCGTSWMTLKEYERYKRCVRRRKIFYGVIVCAFAAALFLL